MFHSFLSLRSLSLGAFLAVFTAAAPAATSAPPVLSSDAAIAYTEGGEAAVVAPNFTAAGGTSYRGGYLQFAVSSGDADETLALTTVEEPDIAAGAVSVVGTTVYLGNGVNAGRIGSVDAAADGTGGSPLKINFTSEAFDNSSFEDGTTNGWTITNQRVIINGATMLAGWPVPSDPTTPSNGNATSPGDGGSASMNYNHAISSNVAADGVNGTKSLSMSLSGSVSAYGGVVRGPSAISASSFPLVAGDSVSFWWSAVGSSDAYDVFGYIVNVDNGQAQILLNATGNSGSATQPWTKVTATVSASGNYRFVFICGSFDFSFGGALGASLLLDSIEITSSSGNVVDDAVVQALGRLVTYQNLSDNPPATRTLTISAANTDGEIGSVTSQVAIAGVNDAPVVSATGAFVFTPQQSPAVVNAQVTVADVDDANLQGARVALTKNRASGDTLALIVDSATMGGISASFDSSSGVLTLSGTASLAEYETALRAVTFVTTSSSAATRSITFDVTDAGATGVSERSATVSLTATPTAPAPVITSALTATGTYGSSFSYAITASSLLDLTGYSATGLPLGLALDPVTGVISGTPAEVTGSPFSVTIGAANASATGTATLSIIVAKADQTVNFGGLTDVTINAPAQLSASSSSGLTTTFEVVSGDASIVDGKLVVASAGSDIVIRVTQAGDANHNPSSVTYTIPAGTITKLSQTIVFAELPDQMTTAAPFSLSAAASSGLAVKFAVASGPAKIVGDTLTLDGVSGVVVVEATQAGDSVYQPAPSVTRSFRVVAVGPQVYFGTAGGTDAIAANLAQDNSSGVLLGYLSSVDEAFVLTFTPDENGGFSGIATTFTGAGSQESAELSVESLAAVETSAAMSTRKSRSATTTSVARAVTGTTGTLTFTGTITDGVMTGTIVELGVTFTLAMQPQTGPSADIAGYYTAPALDTADGHVYSIVGTQETVYVLAVTSEALVSGTASLGSNYTFALAPSAEVSLAGQLGANGQTVTGTITIAGETSAFLGTSSTTARTDRLLNLSSRANVGATGEQTLITGFVIGGSEPKTVLLRAVGPALAQFGVANRLAAPRLRLFDHAGRMLREVAGWGGDTTLADTFESVGAFAYDAGSQDAALVATLAPGAYTMHVNGNGATGVALAEIYDTGTSATQQRLLNISSRGNVSGGEGVLIGGFVVGGNAPKRVLIRAVGPALRGHGVSAPLADPTLALYSGSDVIARNDNWETPVIVADNQTAATAGELAEAATATGAFALTAGSTDAALIVTLAPGPYTVHVGSGNGTTGIALVEVYEIPE
ncbi:MAG TPA: Ig domain-containing protein [Opitutaceae bacterium]